MVVLPHIGSARNEFELVDHRLKAANWINDKKLFERKLLLDDLPVVLRSRSLIASEDVLKISG